MGCASSSEKRCSHVPHPCHIILPQRSRAQVKRDFFPAVPEHSPPLSSPFHSDPRPPPGCSPDLTGRAVPARFRNQAFFFSLASSCIPFHPVGVFKHICTSTTGFLPDTHPVPWQFHPFHFAARRKERSLRASFSIFPLLSFTSHPFVSRAAQPRRQYLAFFSFLRFLATARRFLATAKLKQRNIL